MVESILTAIAISNVFMFISLVLIGREYNRLWNRYVESEKKYLRILLIVNDTIKKEDLKEKEDNVQ